MVDFDLTEFDQELLALTHAQAIIARAYARHYDLHEGERVPNALPEARDHPDVREMLRLRAADTSGEAILDTLVFLEEVWGTIPFRKGSNPSTFLGSKLLMALGSPDQIALWRDKLIAIALTEPDAGSDPSRIRALAVHEPATDQWVLNGEKIYISLAHDCDAALVFARFADGEQRGLCTFIVDKGTPGFTVGSHLRKLGQRSWDTANLLFTDCRLPGICRLTGSMKATLAVFNRSRPLVAAIGLGFARAALDFTRERLIESGHQLRYEGGGTQGSPLADRFMRIEAEYESAWLTLLHAKWIESVSDADKVEASITKANAGIAARRITQECMALLGAEAISEEHLVEMWLRDARVCDIYEGPGEVNRLIVARELLGYSASELN